jgi:hypothetical protein
MEAIKMEEFEAAVIELIRRYGAPDNVSLEMENFLIESGNAITIVELGIKHDVTDF